MPGFRRRGDVDGDGVGPTGHVERVLGVFDTELLAVIDGEQPRPSDHSHPEGLGPPGDLPPDLAKADDAQGTAMKAPGL